MSCCEKCNAGPEVERTEFAVAVNFKWSDFNLPVLIGKDLGLGDVQFTDLTDSNRKEDYYVKMSSTGDNHILYFYRKTLPFDLLMGTLQFSSVTGNLMVRNYGKLIDFPEVTISFTKNKTKDLHYTEISSQMYRCHNAVGLEQLIHVMRPVSAECNRIRNAIKNEAQVYPLFVMRDGADNIIMRVIYTDAWKINTGW